MASALPCHITHPPLGDAKRQIRLLSFENPEETSDTFKLTSRVYSMVDEPIYAALSYTWGEEQDTHTISLNGVLHNIGANLFHALGSLRCQLLKQRAAMRACFGDHRNDDKDSFAKHFTYLTSTLGFRGSSLTRPKLLWIDALCINQQNLDEKRDQVGIMSSIYASALLVPVWLGPKCSAAFRLFVEFFRPSIPTKDHNDFKGFLSEHQNALDPFLHSQYWQRAWVIQEFLRARRIVFISSDDELSSLDLEYILLHSVGMEGLELEKDGSSSPSFLLWWRAHSIKSLKFSSLCYFIAQLGAMHCKVPKDRVYSLLGLIDWEKSPWLAPLEADYEIDEAELLRRIMLLARVDELKKQESFWGKKDHGMDIDIGAMWMYQAGPAFAKGGLLSLEQVEIVINKTLAEIGEPPSQMVHRIRLSLEQGGGMAF